MAEINWLELEDKLLEMASEHPIAACTALGLGGIALSGILTLPFMYLNARITARAVIKALRR